ncbi:odorant receptor 94b-like [Chironomus tepperi]|uniref:odorant receptor 94b-like n=1 Tax=Chironomus tepperi TaxID=113505 RepID=UPI00391F8C5E
MKAIRKVFLMYWSTCPTSITLAFAIALKDAQSPPFMTQYKIYSPTFFNFEQNYLYFVITEIYALISAQFASTSAVAMDFLAVFFFSIGAGLLEELASRIAEIENVLDNENSGKDHDDKTIDELNKCILIHAKIKKFLVSAQNLVSPIIIIQVVISTAVICMTCYTISMFSPADGASVFFRQITYMIPMGLQIFIPCYYGNEIMIAAERFSMDIFHTKWYNGCKKFRTAFNTLLIHASQPLIMISGVLFQVTLENFVAVSRLSYKFYAVMQNMNAKHDIFADLRDLLEVASKNQIKFGHFMKKRMKKLKIVFFIYWSTCPFTINLAFITAIMAAKEPPYMTHYKLYAPPFFNFEQNYSYFILAELYAKIGAEFAASTAVILDFLGCFFFSMGAGLLEELGARIANIETELKEKITIENGLMYHKTEKEHDNETVKELKKCIIIHAKIKKFLEAAQSLVSPIIYIQVVISTAVICMTCYTISMFSSRQFSSYESVWAVLRQITYMMPMGLQIFIPCYFGNEIMIAAEKFSLEIFHSKWYDGSIEYRKIFKTLLTNASQPLVMISGVLFKVTLENFVVIAQLTYKYYAVMQNMNGTSGMENMKGGD